MTDFRIACLGDVMCGDQFQQIGWGISAAIDRYGKDFLSSDIISILDSHDLVLCNIESALSDIGRNDKSVRSLHMRGRPSTARWLKEWGINMATVANNHILEHGLDAAEDTVRVLQENNIMVVGTDTNRRFTGLPDWTDIKLNGHPVSVIGFCLRKEKYAYTYSEDLQLIYTQIQEKKEAGNTVIVSVHWGDELIDRPSLSQRKIAYELLASGAVLVAGHHPHVVQGIFNQQGGLVLYSLGNFIFDSWCRHTSWSIIASVGIHNGSVSDYQIFPIIRSEDYRPILAEGAMRDRLLVEVKKRNKLAERLLNDEQGYLKQYQDELRRLTLKDRFSLWLRIVMYFWKIPFRYWCGVFLRPILRRTGNW